MVVRIQSDAFDTGAELAAFCAADPQVGALVTFTGLVRDTTGDLKYMQIEHYPAMTRPAIQRFEAKAVTRWSLSACLVIHRYGQLAPGQQIMMVATAAPHRAAAFEAAEFLMDYLKSRAPFWKKEITRSGAQWVGAKDADEDALNRWSAQTEPRPG